MEEVFFSFFFSQGETVRLFHLQAGPQPAGASPIGKLFPFIEQWELSINCLTDGGKVDITPGLNAESEPSRKNSCEQ